MSYQNIIQLMCSDHSMNDIVDYDNSCTVSLNADLFS